MAKRVDKGAATGRFVKVSTAEKRAAQLRVKVNERRGQPTSKVIRSVAQAKCVN